MDIQPGQSISDDQELAKVLAGITAGADQVSPTSKLSNDLSQASNGSDDNNDVTMMNPEADPEPAQEMSPEPAVPADPEMPAEPAEPAAPVNSDLESVKNDALSQLRPLVDKLNVSPEEKFDTYLLIIRSTDDTSLIAPANEAAKAIEDEARRAQALLDIIKEIDYFANPQKQTA